MRPVTRINPRLAPEHMKTYAVAAPQETHYRPASCAEVGCEAYQNGWKTVIDESTELGQSQAHYITHDSGRRYLRQPVNGDGPVVYTFEAGQQCFRPHQVRTDRPELYIVREGDWRGNPRGTQARVHANPEDWLDDFATHQGDLADRLKRG